MSWVEREDGTDHSGMQECGETGGVSLSVHQDNQGDAQAAVGSDGGEA